MPIHTRAQVRAPVLTTSVAQQMLSTLRPHSTQRINLYNIFSTNLILVSFIVAFFSLSEGCLHTRSPLTISTIVPPRILFLLVPQVGVIC